MDITQLRSEYTLQSDRARRLQGVLCEQIERSLGSKGIALGVPIESRVKTLESLEEKVERRSLELKNLTEINDLVGIRIILLFRRDVPPVSELLTKTFEIISTEDTATHLAETQFGYQSLHHVVRIPRKWLEVPTFSDLGELKAEIQLRTLAQHIWAAASHKLQYKHEESVPPPIRRSIHRVSALLETVDLEFERVLAERGTYIAGAAGSIERDELLNVDLLASILSDLLPPENKGDAEPYADLLRDLTYFDITSPNKLREMIKRNLIAVLKEEARILKERKDKKEYTGSSKERIDRGVYFVHVGLAREAMRQEFGQQAFSDYQLKQKIDRKLPNP